MRVGGFYRLPTRQELLAIVPELEQARQIALATVRWVKTFDFPSFEQDYTFVALQHPSEYPMNEGRIVSNKGLNIGADEFDAHFEEIHVQHSNALHCVMKDSARAYHVGPMARYALNFHQLPGDIQSEAKQAGLGEVCHNPFQRIIVRSIEVLYACDEALRIINSYQQHVFQESYLERGYQQPTKPFIDFEPKAATGFAVTEAPRGLLYHRYELDNNGDILDCDIIPPTSQNQKMIEDDLWKFVPQYLSLSDEKLQWHAEQAIRNYDPCISCATHFLKLEIDRS